MYFDIWQDTDGYGNYISPPKLNCGKGHTQCSGECEDFKEWKND